MYQGPAGGELRDSLRRCHDKTLPGRWPDRERREFPFSLGKESDLSGYNFDYHLISWKAAIGAGTAQIMPYYSRPIGTQWEEVAFGFKRAS